MPVHSTTGGNLIRKVEIEKNIRKHGPRERREGKGERNNLIYSCVSGWF